MMATPSAPPTWRVVSFTAEPTPALPSGNEPMIDSVAGAIVSAMPQAMSTMRKIDVGPVRAVDGERRQRARRPDGRRAARPVADHELGAEPLARTARSSGEHDHHHRGDGRNRMPVSNGE